jgi:hypothetical protein
MHDTLTFGQEERCSAELLNVAVQRRDLLLADQVSDAFVQVPSQWLARQLIATMELMRQTCDQLYQPQKPGWSLHAHKGVGRYTGMDVPSSSV